MQFYTSLANYLGCLVSYILLDILDLSYNIIFLMSKKNSQPKDHDSDGSSSPPSQGTLTGIRVQQNLCRQERPGQQKKPIAKNNLQALISTLVVLLTTGTGAGAGYYYFSGRSVQVFENLHHELYVHCPAIYFIRQYAKNVSLFEKQDILDYLLEYHQELLKSYVVTSITGTQLISSNSSEQQKSSIRVRYCGAVRSINQSNCLNARLICSNPGPSFDVQQNQGIQVLWINNYTKPFGKDYLFDNLGKNKDAKTYCYNTDQSIAKSDICIKQAMKRQNSRVCSRNNQKNPQSIKCGSTPAKKTIKISKDFFKVETTNQAVPLSPHVHGLQVEPYYDGNPMSWFDNNGSVGSGFYYPKDHPEFSVKKIPFYKHQTFKYIMSKLHISLQNTKLNIYRNSQQPGTLWYHDHAMGVTMYNVLMGLHSFYVIRDKKAQKMLPKGEYQKVILLLQTTDTGQTNRKGSYSKSCIKQCNSTNSQLCRKCSKEQGNVTSVSKNTTLKSHATYRFRILNGDYKKRYPNIQFVISNNCTANQKNCQQKLNFTVIGTDSALKRFPVNNQMSVSLASAERVDIVITIKSKRKIVQNNSYLIVRYTEKEKVKEINSYLIQKNTTQYPQGLDIIHFIDVPFVNLTQIDQNRIAVKRMRALFFSQASSWLGINFHPRFHDGYAENPKIGTIEDWYIINTMSFGHPIHIHLIQFQALQVRAIRTFDENNCSYYKLDAIHRQISKNKNQNSTIQDYSTFCKEVRQKYTKQRYTQIFNQSTDEITIDDKKISGLNVQQKCLSQKQCARYGYTNQTNKFKYIDQDKDMSQYLLQYQRGWKQTFFVPEFSYAKLRVRWTRTDFPPDIFNHTYNSSYRPDDKNRKALECAASYFDIDQQQLIKCPGYVYHCHFLDHEDKEMMRPIMLEPSGCKNTKSWKETWEEMYCQYDDFRQNQQIK